MKALVVELVTAATLMLKGVILAAPSKVPPPPTPKHRWALRPVPHFVLRVVTMEGTLDRFELKVCAFDD